MFNVIVKIIFQNIMSKRCSSFLGMQQCDAQEFFCTLLENLHEVMLCLP